jgi:hypothetical protein
VRVLRTRDDTGAQRGGGSNSRKLNNCCIICAPHNVSLFSCSLFNDGFSNSVHAALKDWIVMNNGIMNWKLYASNRSYRNLRHYPGERLHRRTDTGNEMPQSKQSASETRF